jgi:hypothetical protein
MKRTILLTFASMLLGGLVLYTTSAKAYQGDLNVKGPNYTEERHEAMTQAFANKDYNAWKELMTGRGRVTQVINEQNFARFAEMHQLMLEGKTDEANQIRTELGLGLHNGSGRGQGMGCGRINR